MRFRNTVFTWHTERCPGDGPHESYSPGESRVVAPVNVQGATADVRAQAASDILGWNALRTLDVGGVTVRYISRQTPMQYAPVRVPPGSPGVAPSLWATSLAGGGGLGVATTNAAGGVDYPQYQFQATFMQRNYAVREDGEVKAYHAAAGYAQSPLLVGGQAFPDEGDRLKKSGVESSRYIRRRFIPSGRLTTVPPGFLQFSDGFAYKESFPIVEISAMVVYEWKLVPYDAIPWQAIRELLGTVDNDPFDGFPVHTMLLTDVGVEYGPGPLGDWLAEVRYTYLYAPKFSDTFKRALGHNAALRVWEPIVAGTNKQGQIDYDEVFSAGNPARTPFRSHRFLPDGTPQNLDHAALFRPDQAPSPPLGIVGG